MIDESRINFLKEKISEEIERNYHRENVNPGPVNRLEKEIEFIKSGCSVEQIREGLLVNNKYVVAAKKNKWKVLGKNTWYWYSNIPTFVEKYVKVRKVMD